MRFACDGAVGLWHLCVGLPAVQDVLQTSDPFPPFFFLLRTCIAPDVLSIPLTAFLLPLLQPSFRPFASTSLSALCVTPFVSFHAGQIALERASSSRQAVLVMGSLAEQYGYDDSAESLIVTDKDEAFIFQIMPDDTATSALWVAQRVPDNHVGVVTNGLTVREVDFEDGSAFLSSSNLRPIAKAKGWWIEGTPFDFTRIFGAAGMGSQYGVGRRMWSAYRLLAPNQEFPSHYNDFINDAPYPATAMTTKKVGLQDVMRVMRDYYQNTSFDMTQGMAAGPFGTPDRWGKGPGEKDVNGTWERTIAIYRSIVTLVLESRSWLPDPVGGTLWFAPHAAHTSTYAPFPCGMDAIPDSYGNASGWGAINRGVAAWANRYVFNMAQLRFSDAIVDVAAARSTLDNASLALQAASDKAYVAAPSTATMVAVSKAFAANADGIVAAWWKLADEIVVKYADGGGHRGYPAWWLASKDVGYTTPL